jgi:hypothetical protein
MKKHWFLPALALIGSGAPAFANDANHPTVVELFQSQGCSSCPPAIANINGIADRPEILALTFAVTYWDRLGWKDSFAKPAFTERERDYARTGTSQFATPQTVINGRASVNGGDRAQLVAAIRAHDRGITGPAIDASGGKVTIGKAATAQSATIWLVRYDVRALSVPIRAGENGGRTLVHRNVVRSLTAIGTWNGGAGTVAIPANADHNLRSAVLVQAGPGGRIMAAARL